MELAPGERVMFEGHPSWRSILTFYVKGLLVVVLAGAVAALVTRVSEDEVKALPVAAVVVLALLIVLVVGWLKRIATTYVISTRRLHIKRGIVSRRTQEAQLARVQNVNTSQSILERLLRVGKVDFDTAGSGDYDFTFTGVAQPHQVVQAVDRAQHEAAAEPEQRSESESASR